MGCGSSKILCKISCRPCVSGIRGSYMNVIFRFDLYIYMKAFRNLKNPNHPAVVVPGIFVMGYSTWISKWDGGWGNKAKPELEEEKNKFNPWTSREVIWIHPGGHYYVTQSIKMLERRWDVEEAQNWVHCSIKLWVYLNRWSQRGKRWRLMREGESRALQLHLMGMQEKVDSQRLMGLTRVDEVVFAINYEGPASFWRRLLCIESHSALHPYCGSVFLQWAWSWCRNCPNGMSSCSLEESATKRPLREFHPSS